MSTTHHRPRARTEAGRRAAVVGIGLSLALTVAAVAPRVVQADAPSAATAANGDVDEIVQVNAAQTSTFAYDAGGSGYEVIEFTTNTQATLVRHPYVIDPVSGNLVQDIYSFEGVLAESYEVSDDGLRYTFHLRQGVISPAGNELDADDVLWSYERKFAATTSPVRSLMNPMLTDLEQQMHKLDEYTVAIDIAKPSYGITLLSMLGNMTGGIYDSDLLQEQATADDPYAVEWSKTNPNFGYGAYLVESFRSGEETVLVANPDYVLGEPNVKRIIQRVVPDAGNRATVVRNGDADIAVQLRPVDVADLGDAGLSTFEVPVANNNSFALMTLTTTRAPFDNELVRQAVAYAIPYEQIIENVYFGRAERVRGQFIVPGGPGYSDEGFPQYEYDPERAKELLAEAGYPDGIAFTLTVSDAIPDIQEAAIQIQSFAHDAGMEISIETMPNAAFIAGRSTEEFQAFMMRSLLVTLTPQYSLVTMFNRDSPVNFSRWVNDEYLSIVADGQAIDDPYSVEAGEYWNRAERLSLTAAPMPMIAAVQPVSVFGPSVTGWAWRSDNALDYTLLHAPADA